MKTQVYSWKNIIGSVAMMSVLVACGGSGGDGPPNGTPPPVESTFAIEHTFSESETAFETWFQAYSLNRIENRSGYTAFYDQAQLDAARRLAFEFDADKIEADFDSETFADWYFPWVSGSPAPVTISNTEARLKITSNMRLGQYDSNRIGFVNNSHTVQFEHDYSRADGSETSSFARGVFSDRAVEFTGEFDMNGYTMEVDMRLQPGWNLVASEFHFDADGSVQTWQSYPIDTATLYTYPLTYILSNASDLNTPYDLVAVYPLHQVHAEPTAVTPISTHSPQSNVPTYGEFSVPIWLHPSHVESGALVPVAEAAGSHPDTDIVAPPELNVLIARALTFDETNPDVSNADNATGELFATTPEGNAVVFLYADHESTVEINNWVTPFTGEIMSADAPLELVHGWNLLVTVPDPDSATRDYRLIHFLPFELAPDLTHQLN